MKTKSLFAAAVACALILTACDKENDGLQLQAHDQNRMMDSMHAMMSRMMAMPMTEDPDIDFSEMMMMHHRGAISMANIQLESGANDSLKRTAQKIITEQQMEIEELEAIRSGLVDDNSDPSFGMEQMESMMKGQKVADVQIITGDTDNDFATLMIVHHQGAIDNASSYLHHGENIQLRSIASRIIEAQNMEIQELGNWLIANRR